MLACRSQPPYRQSTRIMFFMHPANRQARSLAGENHETGPHYVRRGADAGCRKTRCNSRCQVHGQPCGWESCNCAFSSCVQWCDTLNTFHTSLIESSSAPSLKPCCSSPCFVTSYVTISVELMQMLRIRFGTAAQRRAHSQCPGQTPCWADAQGNAQARCLCQAPCAPGHRRLVLDSVRSAQEHAMPGSQ